MSDSFRLLAGSVVRRGHRADGFGHSGGMVCCRHEHAGVPRYGSGGTLPSGPGSGGRRRVLRPAEPLVACADDAGPVADRDAAFTGTNRTRARRTGPERNVAGSHGFRKPGARKQPNRTGAVPGRRGRHAVVIGIVTNAGIAGSTSINAGAVRNHSSGNSRRSIPRRPRRKAAGAADDDPTGRVLAGVRGNAAAGFVRRRTHAATPRHLVIAGRIRLQGGGAPPPAKVLRSGRVPRLRPSGAAPARPGVPERACGNWQEACGAVHSSAVREQGKRRQVPQPCCWPG
jgi:hypothetical protein